jgi:hypothetical protein
LNFEARFSGLRLWHNQVVPKRPVDANQLAKLIVDISTGEVEDAVSEEKKRPQAKRGQPGGLKGGTARAKRLSRKNRVEIARLAAAARWKKS